MCEEFPGPRCSYDTETKLRSREVKLADALEKYGKDSFEAELALARLEKAQEYYDATPEGLRTLKDQMDANPEDSQLAQRYYKADLTRTLQINALKEIRTGRVAALASITQALRPFYDEDETASIIESARENTESWTLRGKNLDAVKIFRNDKNYQEYLNGLETVLNTQYPDGIPEELQKNLEDLRSMPTPDNINLRAYNALPKAFDTSKTQLISEIKNAAALASVEPKVAAAYYEAYRDQYKTDFANLPPAERPDPPTAWVRGEFSQSGYARDFNSNYAPHDPASVYAIYRLRADDKAVPDYLKHSRSIASIDLETAGPEGTAGFEPENGRIIEVGIQVYTPAGKKVSQLDQMVKPEEDFLNKYGTGAENVHQINRRDLDSKPSWSQVQNEVADRLQGKVLLAQNHKFEKKWLAHHLDDFDTNIPIIDTLDVSRKHYDLPNHKLETICNANKVEYTNGHRALHDAEVAATAFFQQRKTIQKAWDSKAARRKAEPVTKLVSSDRWEKKKRTPMILN